MRNKRVSEKRTQFRINACWHLKKVLGIVYECVLYKLPWLTTVLELSDVGRVDVQKGGKSRVLWVRTIRIGDLPPPISLQSSFTSNSYVTGCGDTRNTTAVVKDDRDQPVGLIKAAL